MISICVKSEMISVPVFFIVQLKPDRLGVASVMVKSVRNCICSCRVTDFWAVVTIWAVDMVIPDQQVCDDHQKKHPYCGPDKICDCHTGSP